MLCFLLLLLLLVVCFLIVVVSYFLLFVSLEFCPCAPFVSPGNTESWNAKQRNDGKNVIEFQHKQKTKQKTQEVGPWKQSLSFSPRPLVKSLVTCFCARKKGTCASHTSVSFRKSSTAGVSASFCVLRKSSGSFARSLEAAYGSEWVQGNCG